MSRFLPLPQTLFGRLFLAMLGTALALLVCASAFWYRQAFELLDREAARYLETAAWRLLDEWRSAGTADGGRLPGGALEEALAAVGASWIHNAYWVGYRDDQPQFIASYSTPAPGESNLLPPSVEDIDDLIEDGLPQLEEGNAYFPDPERLEVGRRCKIVLVPKLDRDGVLAGVAGVEADLRYMDLFPVIRRAAVYALFWAVPLCIGASFLVARSVSRRVGLLVSSLDRIGRNEPPQVDPLGITELEKIREGVARLAARLAERDARLKSLHDEKIRELAFTGSAVAHEVRNPLSAIGLHLGLLKRRYAPDGTDLEPFAEIEEQLMQLKTLTDRFLDYSRVTLPVRERFSPAALFRETAAARPDTAGNGTVGIQAEDGLEMTGDIRMWRQIVDNLLDNAVAAARPACAKIMIHIYADGDKCVVRFADAGPGVPADIVPRLFTPFVTGRPDGHGIGLALVRKFVEAHGGEIRYVSPPEGGALFHIEVPIPS
ncbi:MAG TPA: HAMP domain-containing sensor histidine kinase [Candidatus Ozemobacteraceae bacterium]|nr:HAMP domain-containing sensor histidine kinase [Candidatus Ozemobacteraceae bacterium]